MDNNRFNGVGIKVFGNLGEENLAHYFKHKSVETLHISSDGIVVVANVCYDMIQRECEENWLKHMEKAERDSALKNIFQNTVKILAGAGGYCRKDAFNGIISREKVYFCS